MHTFLCRAFLVLCFVNIYAFPCQAQSFTPGPFFADDFEDGDHRDASPANWMRCCFEADADVLVDGSVEIRGVRGNAALLPVEPDGLPYWTYEDFTLTTQLKILDGGDGLFAGVFGRNLGSTGEYFGGIWRDGRLSIGETDASGAVLDVNRLQTSLDPTNNDILLKMDFHGDLMSLTAWELGTDMPAVPQLTYEDSTLPSGVVAMLGSGSGDVAFRWFEVAPVPEPSGFLLGVLAFAGLLLKRDYRHR